MTDIQEQAIQLAQAPYTSMVFREEVADNEFVYVAVNPELEGCVAQGDTVQEAKENLDEVRISYMEHLLEHKLPVPLPKEGNVFSFHIPVTQDYESGNKFSGYLETEDDNRQALVKV